MTKGGYVVIDLTKAGAFTSGTAKTVAGLYDRIKNPTKQALLIQGLKVSTTEYPAFFALFTPVSTSYEATIKIGGATLDILVSNASACTVTVTPDE